MALVSGLLLATAVVWIGHKLGRQATNATTPVAERKRATGLALAPLILIFLAGLYVWNEVRELREAMKIASEREASFADLVSQNQKIEDVSIAFGADHNLEARVRMSGDRNGPYRLSWKVRDSSFSNVLLSGDRSLTLHQGVNEIRVTFTLDQLMHHYRTITLKGQGGVLVDESFRFEVIQEPALTPEEQAVLPPGEASGW